MSAYQIDFSDPLKAGFQIAPGGFNGPGGSSAATTMRLYGRGALEWGEAVDEDLVRLTENFASASPPSSAISGQLWVERKLYYRNTTIGNEAQGWYYYDSNEVAANKWKLLNGTGIVATSAPVTPVAGQYWYDTGADVLYGYYSLGKYEPLAFIERAYFLGAGAPSSSTLPPQSLRVFDQSVSTGTGAWVAPLTTSVTAGTNPSSPQIGLLWYDTSTGNLHVYTGTTWQEILGPGNGTGNTIASTVVDMGGFKITSLGTPTVNTDATTKLYVDSLVGSIASFLPLTGGTLSVTSAPGLTINRTNAAAGSVLAFQTTAGTVYAGQGTAGVFAVDDDPSLTTGPWLTATATAFAVPGSLSVGTTSTFGSNMTVTGSGSFSTSLSTGTTLVVGTNLTVNGTTTMNGLVTLSNDRITGLATPLLGTDATTKDYVDIAVAGAAGLLPSQVALANPGGAPKDCDVRTISPNIVEIYSFGAWRRVFPAQWAA